MDTAISSVIVVAPIFDIGAFGWTPSPHASSKRTVSARYRTEHAQTTRRLPSGVARRGSSMGHREGVMTVASASSASGTTRYQVHVPRRSPTTSPAAASVLKW